MQIAQIRQLRDGIQTLDVAPLQLQAFEAVERAAGIEQRLGDVGPDAEPAPLRERRQGRAPVLDGLLLFFLIDAEIPVQAQPFAPVIGADLSDGARPVAGMKGRPIGEIGMRGDFRQ
jgi:hypothetical protein